MSETLNPEIRELAVGTFKLRSIKIYPLSVHCQFTFTESFAKLMVDFEAVPKGEEISFMISVMEEIKTNIQILIDYVTEEGSEKLLKELTNSQLVQLATIIYEVNYEAEIKNVQDLIKKVKQSLSMRSSLQSSLTQDTESLISMEKLLEKVV